VGGGFVRIAGIPKLCYGNLTWRLAGFIDTVIAPKLLSMQLTAQNNDQIMQLDCMTCV
jgi:hypothetical protein